MKPVIILSCVFGLALCVPVPVPVPDVTRELQPTQPVISDQDQAEAVRKRRHLFGLDIDVYNNNGFGYFDNGYGGGFGGYGYPGYGYGGFGGYPGYGYGAYPAVYPGYGGFVGYPAYGYGGYGGFY